jgi:SAM-dependent methyltransferase
MRAVVLGCGGGQGAIALAKQGAQVVGIDLSDKQIEYGRRLAAQVDAPVTLLQGNVEELREIDDETFDLALSLQALDYVERVERVFAEAFRVLKPDAVFVVSVRHPFDAMLEGTPPFGAVRPYWRREVDWQWEFPEANLSVRLRSWFRPVAEWCALLIDAGFRILTVLEPEPVDGPEPWRNLASPPHKAELVPQTLILKAIRP